MSLFFTLANWCVQHFQSENESRSKTSAERKVQCIDAQHKSKAHLPIDNCDGQ
jgi:hypothetical protein